MCLQSAPSEQTLKLGMKCRLKKNVHPRSYSWWSFDEKLMKNHGSVCTVSSSKIAKSQKKIPGLRAQSKYLTHGKVVVIIVLEDVVELSDVAVLSGELLSLSPSSSVVAVVVVGMGMAVAVAVLL